MMFVKHTMLRWLAPEAAPPRPNDGTGRLHKTAYVAYACAGYRALTDTTAPAAMHPPPPAAQRVERAGPCAIMEWPRWLLALIAVLLTGACATTDPGAAQAKTRGKSFTRQRVGAPATTTAHVGLRIQVFDLATGKPIGQAVDAAQWPMEPQSITTEDPTTQYGDLTLSGVERP
jgi:hypothetical protein